MSHKTHIKSVRSGYPGVVLYMLDAIAELWDTRPEIQSSFTRDEWVRRYKNVCIQADRVEVTVSISGKVVAVALMAISDDVHVGPMLDVLNTHVVPGVRGTGVFRTLMRGINLVAKEANVPFIGLTKYKGRGVYEMRYIQVKHKE